MYINILKNDLSIIKCLLTAKSDHGVYIVDRINNLYSHH